MRAIRMLLYVAIGLLIGAILGSIPVNGGHRRRRSEETTTQEATQ